MSDKKIKKIYIEGFRGISQRLSLSFCRGDKPESVLLFGDNGSGKSSVVDAIEFVTQASIQSNNSTGKSGWLYNSLSLVENRGAVIEVELEDGEKVKASLSMDVEQDQLKKDAHVISEFRFAPFILRRRDILNFWDSADQNRLMLFYKYMAHESENMLQGKEEMAQEIEIKRAETKKKKRTLIEDIASYYEIDAESLKTKGEADLFAFFKLLDKGKKISLSDRRHPKYEQFLSLKKVFKEIGEVNQERRKLKKNDDIAEAPERKKIELSETMKEIAPNVTKAFKEISRTSDYVRRIEITIAEQTEVSLEFQVILENGQRIEPTMLFSEANRDLLALLIYLEFIHNAEQKGQAKVLVLDDVFQSVDSTIRFRVMQYVIDRFPDWQIMLTTHDRLWKEQMSQLFRNHSKPLEQLEIIRWGFETGPEVIGSVNNFDEKLLVSLNTGSTADICASAGYLLEYMCEKLSVILGSSIKRRPGDRYTIGDLWPSIYKDLKKTPAKDIFTNLNDLVYLRNMVGSHYNEWSLMLSRSEANDFADAVLGAYYHVCSAESGKWIRNIGDIKAEQFT